MPLSACLSVSLPACLSVIQATLCFVDIDNNQVEVPEDLPSFPDQDQLAQELMEVLLHFGVMSKATSAPRPPASVPLQRLSSLVLEDLIEDRQNGNLGSEELAVLERLQALAWRCQAGAKTGEEGETQRGSLEYEEREELRAAKMNVQLREVVASRFTAMFGRYEDFVTHSAPHLDSWLSNREGCCNFDKVSTNHILT